MQLYNDPHENCLKILLHFISLIFHSYLKK